MTLGKYSKSYCLIGCCQVNSQETAELGLGCICVTTFAGLFNVCSGIIARPLTRLTSMATNRLPLDASEVNFE